MRIDPGIDSAMDTADAADVAEQQAALDDASADDLPRAEMPLEADPADVAEQDVAVPYDEER
jgi:hypothetical protein